MTGSGLYTPEELYRLLPAFYRVRDAEEGGVLRELVDVLTDQVNVLAESLEQAYDDQFVETCPFGTSYLDHAIYRRTECDLGELARNVIGGDWLPQGRRQMNRLADCAELGDAA